MPYPFAAAFATLSLGLAAAAAGAQPMIPTITDLGELPPARTIDAAEAISDDGSVVAGAVGNPARYQAFRWTAVDGMTLLPLLGASDRSGGDGISGDGRMVVGDSVDSATGAFRAFRYDATTGLMEALPLPPGRTDAQASDASADGSVIVGNSFGGGTLPQAVRWRAGQPPQMLPLAPGSGLALAVAVSADGSVVAGLLVGESARGFRWTETTGMVVLEPLPGKEDSIVYDISDDGSVVVGSSGPAALSPVRWRAVGGGGWGEAEPLDLLPGWTRGSARGISGDGRLIGGYHSGGGEVKATLWSPTRGVIDLHAHLEALGADLSDWQLNQVNDLSSDGSSLIGIGRIDGARRSFLITGLPTAENCPMDLNASGELDFFDFLEFQNLFAAGDPRADIDGDGVLTVLDFMAYQDAFSVGCI